MEIATRPVLHLGLFLTTMLFVLAAINSNEIASCEAITDNDAESPVFYTIFTYHSTKIAMDERDSLSMRKVTAFDLSYDPISFSMFPNTTRLGDLPTFAKTSYIGEILAAAFLLIALIVYSKTQLSASSKILATLSSICLLLAAIMATIVVTMADDKANSVTQMFLFGDDDQSSGSGSDSAPNFKTCIMATSGIFSWTAVGLWTLLLIDLWRLYK